MRRLAAVCLLVIPGGLTSAAEDQESLAKSLTNPVADLISVPFQLNYDPDIGPINDGERWTLNIQPVFPMTLTPDWNVISRTILPIISQDEITPGSGSQSGIGDTIQSFFFSPKKPTRRGWIWGAGPAALLPTDTDDDLGAGKWAFGPTGVILRQSGPWTYGGLGNQLWSVSGSANRTEINATFLQPFLAYTTSTAWTFTANSESTYDWEQEKWSVPVHLLASKVVLLGQRPVSFGGGARYWAVGPDSGPDGLGFRVFMTLLYPR